MFLSCENFNADNAFSFQNLLYKTKAVQSSSLNRKLQTTPNLRLCVFPKCQPDAIAHNPRTFSHYCGPKRPKLGTLSWFREECKESSLDGKPQSVLLFWRIQLKWLAYESWRVLWEKGIIGQFLGDFRGSLEWSWRWGHLLFTFWGLGGIWRKEKWNGRIVRLDHFPVSESFEFVSLILNSFD